MSITKEMMEKLMSVGFRFEEFEGHLDSPGNVFFYNGVEHTIGGAWDGSPVGDEDKKIAREGLWLPDTDHLMLWLEWHDISVNISYSSKDRYFHGDAKTEDGKIFEGGGSDLQMCLYKLVLKVSRYLKENNIQY